MRKFLQQAVFATVLTAQPACQLPQIPDYPPKVEAVPAKDYGMGEILALCKEQKKAVLACLEENDLLAIKMAQQHLENMRLGKKASPLLDKIVIETESEAGKTDKRIKKLTIKEAGGRILKEFSFDANGKISQLTKMEKGKTVVVKVGRDSQKPYFEKANAVAGQPEDRGRLITENGTKIGVYTQEKSKTPNLTPDEYLDLLAKNVNTPLYWRSLLELCKLNAATIASSRTNAEWFWFYPDKTALKDETWRTPDETVQNDLGGTDIDGAFLLQEILKRQGLKSQVGYVPRAVKDYGASVIWIMKRPDQKFDFNYITASGLYKNFIAYDPDAEKDFNESKGFVDIEEMAIAGAKMMNADTTDLRLGLSLWDEKIPVMKIPEKGQKEFKRVSYKELLN